jgi:glycosyltransferase involved in cell wall biosynthesis
MHGHWVIPGGVIATLAAPHLPLVVSLHGSDIFVAERHALLRRAARTVFSRAGAVTGPSADLCRRAIALGAPTSDTTVVPYGVDPDRFAPDADARRAVRQELGLGESPLVVAAGRLVEKKGFAFLIEAAAQLATRHPALTVVIAGDGDLRGQLEALAQRLHLHNVQFMGNRRQDDVARLFMAADVVVVPSIVDDAGNVDGLPNSALEALATGTPVVATDAGGLAQLVTDGANGRIVAQRDGPALAQAIDDVLRDPDRARALGAAARARVARDFGWPRVAEAMEVAYTRACVLASCHRR